MINPCEGQNGSPLTRIIVCPVCHGKLILIKKIQSLSGKIDHLAYPVRDNIPVLLENEARELSLEEEKTQCLRSLSQVDMRRLGYR